MLPATASNQTLPIIDVGGLNSPDPQDRLAVARDMRAACENSGFFYIRNHGIDAALIDAMMAEAERFFAQPLADKLALDKSLSRCHRGYEPLRAQTLEAGAPPDLKEGFYIGVELPEDDPRVVAGKFNHGPNQWPDLPGFRASATRYFDALYELAAKLVRALALSLDLPENHFDASFIQGSPATLRLLHYPPQPAVAQPGEKGCGAHTDFGCFTLLLQDDAGGLQVLDSRTGAWMDAPPLPGTYVVNIGDLIERWTNGRYHSTLHRVVNLSGRERHSVPFFFVGNPDCLVECLPTCLAEGEHPRHAPVTVEQHLAECYRRTYA